MPRSIPDIDVAQFAGETVRVQVSINSPEVLEAEVSSTGKTMTVDMPTLDRTHQLDTEVIMAGERECPSTGTYCFQLYTYDNFNAAQSANWGPGPQAGANEISDKSDLPEPTHEPIQE